jgi:hypothetical protein
MKRKMLAFTVAILAASGWTIAQPPPSPTPGHVAPPVELYVAQPVVSEPKPEVMSIDQLLEAIEKIRAQKAELEKKERQMMKEIQLKAALQKQRIDKLVGVTPAADARPAIEGVSPIPLQERR